jgi:hypothetical protein
MASVISRLPSEFMIKHERDSSQADVLVSQQEAAELLRKGKNDYELISNENQRWKIDRKVDGRISPFSIVATSETPNEGREKELKIKNHLFQHKGNFYMIGTPEGKSRGNFNKGAKYIVRLVNFPFPNLDSIDPEIVHRLGRMRGVPVASFSGLGANGFHATFEKELEEIGLPLAVISYLIYSSF